MSLEDQMVDRMLFGGWAQAEIDHVDQATSKTGWAPIPEGHRLLEAAMPNESHCVAVDKSSWDWTCPWWVLADYVRVKLEQTVDVFPGYERAVWNRIAQVLGPDCRCAFPNGEVYRQKDWGLMKSGFLLTLSMNSAAQSLQHHVVELRALRAPDNSSLSVLKFGSTLWAMGDDSLVYLTVPPHKIFLEEYCRQLATLGCLVKHAFVRREFAGFHFPGRGVVTPLYPLKHRFSLAHVKRELVVGTIQAYSFVYSCASDKDQLWLDKERRAREMPSASYFRAWGLGLPVSVPLGLLLDLV